MQVVSAIKGTRLKGGTPPPPRPLSRSVLCLQTVQTTLAATLNMGRPFVEVCMPMLQWAVQRPCTQFVLIPRLCSSPAHSNINLGYTPALGTHTLYQIMLVIVLAALAEESQVCVC